jgi:hypothetical protein
VPPTDLTTSEILDRLDARDQRASVERHDQTTAFTDALREQTQTFSAIVERESTLARGQLSQIVRLGAISLGLLVLGVLALAGVSVKYGGAPGTLELTPATTDATNPADIAPALGTADAPKSHYVTADALTDHLEP